jgi:hypothetical protein
MCGYNLFYQDFYVTNLIFRRKTYQLSKKGGGAITL